MAERVGPRACIIEFGSGSGLKTRLLLEHLQCPAAYVPVDISREHLEESARAWAADFPGLEIIPVAADFTHPFPVPVPGTPPARNLLYFPGSTIGNFSRQRALELLRVMHQEAGEGGCLLIGVDLVKDVEILERAYNDSRGITAKFNLNMLKRINNEFGADFDLDQFQHRAVYDEEHGRIEMRLYSRENQEVTVGGETFGFERDEFLITEHSHKYTLDGFQEMAEATGFCVDQVWTDSESWFSVQYCARN
jgi:dimethylhistidine N-methyltransferase